MKIEIIPYRLPLNYHTLRHIAGQCKTSAKRTALLRREIALTCANVEWGIINPKRGTVALDNIHAVLVQS